MFTTRLWLGALCLVLLPLTTSAQPSSGVAVQGSLTREAIQQVIRQQMPTIRNCYELALREDPNLEGTVRLRFTIEADGSVQSSAVADEAQLAAPLAEVGRCVVRLSLAWHFPAPRGGGVVVVNYPFAFRPSGAGGGGTGGGGTVYGGAGGAPDMRPAGPRPRVRVGRTAVQGSLAPEIIRRVIRRHINEARYCYERVLVRNPGAEGMVRVRFVIGADGQVQSSALEGDTPESMREVAACVVRAVRRWRFPRPEGGGVVVVRYPFVFQPDR